MQSVRPSVRSVGRSAGGQTYDVAAVAVAVAAKFREQKE